MIDGKFIEDVVGEIVSGRVRSKRELHRLKIKLSSKYGLKKIPRDSDILFCVPSDVKDEVLHILQTKKVRSLSGVSIIAVMSPPHLCPHGKCAYCPGGVDYNTPQSYTGKEPAAMRAVQNDYDSYKQVKARLEQLKAIGHPTDKIDLIVMGGTFNSMSIEQQEKFIKGCYDAMNDNIAHTLQKSIKMNEIGPSRCIGMTIETRPDICTHGEIRRMMSFGMTRIELGVQSLSDESLKKMKRGHGVDAIIKATKLVKDSGLKLCYHLMPGFPGVSRDDELMHYKRIFEDERFMPDMLKIYPTLVLRGTELYDMWKRGEYTPMNTEEACKFIANVKEFLPEWVRIQRIQRDIPAYLICDGVKKSNLRQIVKEYMMKKGKKCRCIRCREVGRAISEGRDLGKNIEVKVIEYKASENIEKYIQCVDEWNNLYGYVRLRNITSSETYDYLRDCTLIREMKVLGPMAPIGVRKEYFWQHRGIGEKLLTEAIEISREMDVSSIFVTSGVGARNYYRKFGFELYGVHMRLCL